MEQNLPVIDEFEYPFSRLVRLLFVAGDREIS
jgi:hypothetical protein